MKDFEAQEIAKIELIRQKFLDNAKLFGFNLMDTSPIELLSINLINKYQRRTLINLELVHALIVFHHIFKERNYIAYGFSKVGIQLACGEWIIKE